MVISISDDDGSDDASQELGLPIDVANDRR